MAKYTDSLRGYAHPIHVRDSFTCRYCGLDGKASFDNWLALTEDHLLPKGHPNRDDIEYRVSACHFCNTADNQFFVQAEERGLKFDGLTQQELVAQRKPYVLRTRKNYRDFWARNVETGAMTNC